MRSAFVKAEIFCSASARNGILLQMAIFWLFHRIFHTTLLPVISLQTIMILSLYGWKKSYISNLKSQLPALKESVFNIDTPHLLHTTNKLCNFEKEFETFYREYASYGELSETYACGASTCLLVKVINYALKYSNEFIEIESDQTNQIVRYLDQHFLKEIGVEDLARTFHMSKSSLNKFFQKQLNTTCHQYILKKRLALAVSLIRQDVPLKTVAVQSGFGDYSSFFRAFKKMYHISPTECQADNEKLKKIKH